MSAFRAGLLAASLSVLAVRAQPPSETLTALIDADTPVADRANAARLLYATLAERETNTPPEYVVLHASSSERIAAEERDAFREAPFDVAGPPGPGVLLDFSEAVEVARKNESLRTLLLGRECRRGAAGTQCSIDIDAAAKATIERTEATTAAKLRRIADAAARAGGTVLVASAGLPYRDDRRVDLDRTVQLLRASGVRLVVLRVPSTLRYGGLVHDALEELARQSSAPFVELRDDESASRARRALADILPLPLAAVPLQALPGPWPVSDGSEAAVEKGTDARNDDAFARATAYVARFEQSFSSVIWRERYEQQSRTRVKFGSSGNAFWRVSGQRTLDADLFLVWLPHDASWIAVRDVIAVDGRPLPAAERKLPSLLKADTIAIGRLEELAGENGRFNIGAIAHTFNEPTLALLLLDRQYRNRFTFTRGSSRSTGGRSVVAYTFTETGRPTVIRNRGRDVPMSGTVTIDAARGDVLETSIDLVDPSERLRGTMQVRYAPHATFDVLVPIEMRENYTSPAAEEITTVARYSNFRRFETGARLIVPK